jgi:hypothetical protein
MDRLLTVDAAESFPIRWAVAGRAPARAWTLKAGALRPSTGDGRAIRSKAGLARTQP